MEGEDAPQWAQGRRVAAGSGQVLDPLPVVLTRLLLDTEAFAVLADLSQELPVGALVEPEAHLYEGIFVHVHPWTRSGSAVVVSGPP